MSKFKDSKIGQVLLGAASIINPTLWYLSCPTVKYTVQI